MGKLVMLRLESKGILLSPEGLKRRPIVFTHIPKTAGSSFVSSILRKLSNKVPSLSHRSPKIQMAFLENAKAKGVAFVSGHLGYRLAVKVFPEAAFAVSLRRPLDRTLSHYFNWIRRHPNEVRGVSPEELRCSRFFAFLEHSASRQGDNLMCRMICGTPDAKRALEFLQHRYALAWDISATAIASAHVASALEITLTPLMARKVVADMAGGEQDLLKGHRPADYEEFLTQEGRKAFEKTHAQDIQLYAAFCGLAQI